MTATHAPAGELVRLRRLADVLELTPLEGCSVRNWLATARDLLRGGEFGAARYQIAAVARRLGRRRRPF
jgi:hypothetical protein